MEIVQIVHNPTAGDASHSKRKLLELFQETGYKISYVSTDDENWKEFFGNKTDIIFLAGGDGSIHKLAEVLLNSEIPAQALPPIHLLPLGTANNIAKTLRITVNSEYHLRIPGGEIFKFDCGQVTGVENENIFLESSGVGIFPKLISEMKNDKIENELPSEKLKRTLRALLQIVKKFKPQKAKIKTEGITIKGSFLLIEVMNTKYIGPNFELAPNANPGDGYFDLVMIPGQRRKELITYLEKMIKGKSERADLKVFVKTLQVRKVKIKWGGSTVHVDDNLITDYSGDIFSLKINPGALQLM